MSHLWKVEITHYSEKSKDSKVRTVTISGTKFPTTAVRKYHQLYSHCQALAIYDCTVINPEGERLDRIFCGYSTLFNEFRERPKPDFLEGD